MYISISMKEVGWIILPLDPSKCVIALGPSSHYVAAYDEVENNLHARIG